MDPLLHPTRPVSCGTKQKQLLAFVLTFLECKKNAQDRERQKVISVRFSYTVVCLALIWATLMQKATKYLK